MVRAGALQVAIPEVKSTLGQHHDGVRSPLSKICDVYDSTFATVKFTTFFKRTHFSQGSKLDRSVFAIGKKGKLRAVAPTAAAIAQK